MPDRNDVDKLIIGSFCSIGSGAAFIMAGNQGHQSEWISTFPFHFMPEFDIFTGAIIGSRALVTKDIEPYTIIGGNPAKVIRKRFSDEEISLLLEMRWWDWSDELLDLLIKFINLAIFIETIFPSSGRPHHSNFTFHLSLLLPVWWSLFVDLQT